MSFLYPAHKTYRTPDLLVVIPVHDVKNYYIYLYQLAKQMGVEVYARAGLSAELEILPGVRSEFYPQFAIWFNRRGEWIGYAMDEAEQRCAIERLRVHYEFGMNLDRYVPAFKRWVVHAQ